MKSPAKKVAENNRGITGHISALHNRLYHALNLGLRCNNDKECKWQCMDIEIQKSVVRSVDAFLDCVTKETSNHTLVKDSVADMVGALQFILQFKNESILKLASNVALKMINVIPNSILQPHVLDLVRPLSSLLSSTQLRVSLTCAAALRLILDRLSSKSKSESQVLEILSETNTVKTIICYLQEFPNLSISEEYLQEMVSLLSQILWLWPTSRFPVWNDTKLMRVLDTIALKADFSVKVVIMQLHSSIALCSNGANKLLEDGEALIETMVHSMNISNSPVVMLEAYKLAQSFAMSEERCMKMMKISREPLIEAVVSGMSNWSLQDGKFVKGRMSLLLEACRLCMVITRYAGDHHHYFWKLGVDQALLDLLIDKTYQPRDPTSVKEQIKIAEEGLKKNVLLSVRPYVWDILGYLVAHCEALNPKNHENEININLLIACACSALIDSIQTSNQVSQGDNFTRFGNEAASRAAVQMIFSPSKYIASQARYVLSEKLKTNGNNILKNILNTLDATLSRDKFRVPDNIQIIINLIGLACYVGLPEYRKLLKESRGIKKLLAFITQWLSNPIHVKRLNTLIHLYGTFNKRTCCYDFKEEWEGEDGVLLFSLWGLAELIRDTESGENQDNQVSKLASKTDYNEAELISLLQGICSGSYAPGPRLYAAYILSFFGHYGFQSELGTRIRKMLDEKEHTDLKLLFANQEFLSAHNIIIMVRCPSLLPLNEKTYNSSTKEVRLSAHVDHQALLKLLEFIYSGYFQAGEENLVKNLKVLARHCKMKALLQMLHSRRPKWNTQIPRIDLGSALGSAGYHFSDIILEAKTEDELVDWACNTCSMPMPHMHVHKVILCSCSDYWRALFQSGMQESRSRSIEIPVNWEALCIVVNWIYTNELPVPISGCLWKNMDAEEKLKHAQAYVELCWLSRLWLLHDLYTECEEVIKCCLSSSRKLGVKVVQLAANLFLWELATIAAEYVAPLYQSLRYSGEFDELDEGLVDSIRAASVRFSQEGNQICR